MFKKLLLLTTLIATGTLSAMATAQTVYKFSNWLPSTHPITTEILQPWAQNIEAATEGRVKIQFVPALGKPEAHFELVRDGVADMALGVHAYTTDRFPTAYGMTLPGYANSAESSSVAFWRVYKQHFEPQNEFDGVQLLGLYTHGPAHFYTRADKPIKEINDIKGLRLRTTGGVVQDIANRLSIVPQFSSASKAYELLSQGAVDGVMFNADSVVSFQMLGLLKNAYTVPGGLYRDTHYLVVNPKAWDKLNTEDRALVREQSGEAFARLAGKAWDKADKLAWDKMQDANYVITAITQADLNRLLAQADILKEAWVDKMTDSGIDGNAALKMYRAEIAKVEAERKP